MYKRKIARLVSLIVQIKRYNYKDFADVLRIEQVERLLDSPQIGDRDWENASNKIRTIFDRFLDVYIGIYEGVLLRLKN